MTLDEIDRAILDELQRDARHRTNATISEAVGVSASTVGKRIRRLEAEGVVSGYRPLVDYERAGFPLQVLFVCTVGIAQRHEAVARILALDGVVDVREMMSGAGNLHVIGVGATKDDITAIAREIDEIGITVVDELLVRDEYSGPFSGFEPDDEP